jgi:L-ornithine Nalpha-acyltransferase
MTHHETSADSNARNALTVRLARDPAEVTASQELRFKVFYEEMNARADEETRRSGLDRDEFDGICDHLLVIRQGTAGDGVAVDGGELVGTYRLLRQDIAQQHIGFYTEREFDVGPLIARNNTQKFLELGRSCVLKQHRNKPVVELLWQGIWNYVRENRLDVMFGCASLEGTDISAHADALSYLAHFAAPHPHWHARALQSLHVDMKIRQKDAIDQKRALHSLPPLIKGYLRLGCSIGEGAVIDHQFNTIDVLIILPVSQINPRYFERFGKPE